MTERATRKAANWRTNMVNIIKDNPVPAALVGVGLGWLIMESSGNGGDHDSDHFGYRGAGSYDDYAYGGYGYGDFNRDDARYAERQGYRGSGRDAGQKLQRARHEVGDKVDEMGRRVEETTEDLRHRAESLRDEAAERIEETTGEIRQRAESLREGAEEQWDELRDETSMRARQMRNTARRQGRQAKRSMQNLMSENPLAVGAAAVALGVLVGWAAPATETENRLVGEYRDEFVADARREAQTIANRAQSAAKVAVDDVKEETKAAAKKTVDEVSDESKRAAQRVSKNS